MVDLYSKGRLSPTSSEDIKRGNHGKNKQHGDFGAYKSNIGVMWCSHQSHSKSLGYHQSTSFTLRQSKMAGTSIICRLVWLFTMENPGGKPWETMKIITAYGNIIEYWLVLWNIWIIFPYIGNNHPSWRSHIFQRGGEKPPPVTFKFGVFHWIMAALPCLTTGG